MDFMKINCRYGDIDSAASFNILHDILSGPLALLGLTAFSSFIRRLSLYSGWVYLVFHCRLFVGSCQDILS